ncbi:hypothetical protein PT274_06120 [Leuconostocaceae bacterium ESL0958]|nr:hypothetical protein [Leuconostocaceae bacterium ESL0958]
MEEIHHTASQAPKQSVTLEVFNGVSYTILSVLGMGLLLASLGKGTHLQALTLAAEDWSALGLLLLFGVVLPAAASVVYYYLLRKVGKTKPNDLHLDLL